MKRRKNAVVKDNSERWLLTYADLITLLMVFFVVLYATTTTDLQKFAQLAGSLQKAFNVNVLQGQGSSALLQSGSSSSSVNVNVREQQDYQKLVNVLRSYEQSQGQNAQKITITITSRGIDINVPGELLFYSGTNILKPDGMQALNVISQVVSSVPNNVEVDGHTDNIPENTVQYPTNWELSAARAVAVVRYFIEQDNLNPGRFTAAGLSQYHPIADNSTRDGQARNRRADIIILYPQSAGTGPSIPSAGP